MITGYRHPTKKKFVWWNGIVKPKELLLWLYKNYEVWTTVYGTCRPSITNTHYPLQVYWMWVPMNLLQADSAVVGMCLLFQQTCRISNQYPIVLLDFLVHDLKFCYLLVAGNCLPYHHRVEPPCKPCRECSLSKLCELLSTEVLQDFLMGVWLTNTSAHSQLHQKRLMMPTCDDNQAHSTILFSNPNTEQML